MRALAAFPRPLQIAAAVALALLLASALTFLVERPGLRAIRDFYKKRRLPTSPAANASPSALPQ